MFRARLSVLGVAVALFALAGCTKTAKVEGTVTYKGAPVQGATVTLVNDSGTVVALGSTDASGKFTLLTPQMKDGIPAGEYKALVTKVQGAGDPSQIGGPGEGPMSPEAMKAMRNMGKGAKKSVLPEQFSAKDTTTLTVKVPSDGPVTLNLGS